MNIIKKLAAWLDPEREGQLVTAENETIALRFALKDSTDTITNLTRANEMLREANNAVVANIGKHATTISALRAALKKAQPYVADALDDAMVAADNATAKKRPAALAVAEAVKADYELIVGAVN